MNGARRISRPPTLGMSVAFDGQVNGVGLSNGTIIDYSQHGLTEDMIRLSIERWRTFGTKVFLPTIVTSPKKVYRSNLPKLGAAIRGWAKDDLAGIFLEGPWISRNHLARGAHPRTNCHRERIEEFCEFDDLSLNTIVKIVLAPEWPGALEFIEYVTRKGVVVSLAHHLADPGRVREAIAAGARCSTHVGNACPPQMHRHDVLLWQQILHPNHFCTFITDRMHIGDEFARLAISAKLMVGEELAIIVSDASSAAKAPPGRYTIFNGNQVRVRHDGAVVTYGVKPVKHAGSGSSLMDCMNGAVQLGFDRHTVERMVTDNPWALMGDAILRRLGRTPQDYGRVRRTGPRIKWVKGAFELVGGQ